MITVTPAAPSGEDLARLAWAMAKALPPGHAAHTDAYNPASSPGIGISSGTSWVDPSGPPEKTYEGLLVSGTELKPLLSAIAERAVQLLRDHPPPEAPSISGGNRGAISGSSSRSSMLLGEAGHVTRHSLLESGTNGRRTRSSTMLLRGLPTAVDEDSGENLGDDNDDRLGERRGDGQARAAGMTGAGALAPTSSPAASVRADVLARLASAGLSRQDLAVLRRNEGEELPATTRKIRGFAPVPTTNH